MTVFEAIELRYSHKETFLPDAVPLEHLEQIAKAGITAPSGVNRQTVRLIILPDRKSIDPISEITPHPSLRTTPGAIAILSDGIAYDGMDFTKEDYSAAMENILLAATALGYGSLWLDYPFIDSERQAAAKKLLGIPENHRLWAVVPIGKPDGSGSRREKLPYEARVSYGYYGGVR
ncbi:MAG: nitroreductase family protein [Defluviitaleaceae bacterium]|nr:nitroreductase family protein [Defluviitaleaceae bacterium]